jgi:TRAP-type uncharacterized transport system fused permease subunit
MFVYEPALLMIGDWPTVIWRSLISGVGVILFAGGIFGYFLSPATLWQRFGLTAAGLLLIEPSLATDIAGFLLGAIVIASQVLWQRERRVPVTPEVHRR